MSNIRPPFTTETALQKVKVAQDLWNTRDPARVSLAYTPDTVWRNRDTFIQGREQVVQFLQKKWEKENGYRLRKDLFSFTDNKIAVVIFSNQLSTGSHPRFFYEWLQAQTTGEKQWYRTYGLEDWTFAEDGLMRKRQMSGNDVAITDAQRWFRDGVDVNAVVIPDTLF